MKPSRFALPTNAVVAQSKYVAAAVLMSLAAGSGQAQSVAGIRTPRAGAAGRGERHCRRGRIVQFQPNAAAGLRSATPAHGRRGAIPGRPEYQGIASSTGIS